MQGKDGSTSASMRFPESAALFKFCMAVLEARSPKSKINDQDVGNILQYNPSDTSHWKKGKKSVRNIYALETLSRVLEVDFEIIYNIASGTLSFDEAWYSFLESEKYYNTLKNLSAAEQQYYYKTFYPALVTLAEQILKDARIQTVPVFLPELMETFSFIELQPMATGEKFALATRIKNGGYVIRYRKAEIIRPHVRWAVVQEFARILLGAERERFKALLPPLQKEYYSIEVIDFAHLILVPFALLRQEILRFSAKANLCQSLADIFWAPEWVVRSQLARFLLDYTTSPLDSESLRACADFAHSSVEKNLLDDDVL